MGDGKFIKKSPANPTKIPGKSSPGARCFHANVDVQRAPGAAVRLERRGLRPTPGGPARSGEALVTSAEHRGGWWLGKKCGKTVENLYERYENMEKNKGKPWEIYENMDKMGGTSMNTWKNMRKNYAKF